MKKIILSIILLSALLLPLAACGNPSGEAALRRALKKAAEQPILAFEYGDYEGKGASCAFAFTGPETGLGDDEGMTGQLWYVDAGSAQMLEEGAYWSPVEAASFGGRKFAVVEQYFATGGLVNIYGVKDGNPYKEAVSGHGGAFTREDDRVFLLEQDAYDAMYDTQDALSMGHTSKPYWFYWDARRESFREYGGAAMTVERLLEFTGAEKILDKNLDKGYLITDIFYRSNGLININYRQEADTDVYRYFTTLRLDGDAVTVLQEGEGVYAQALAYDIADYPEPQGEPADAMDERTAAGD